MLDKYHLDGRVALITGGSRGIGKSIALGFAEAGAEIVIASRKIPYLEEAARQISALGRQALPVAAHVAKKEEIDNLVSKTMAKSGRIDILVNNAGTNPYLGETIYAEEWAWDAIMNLNVKGHFLLSQAVAKVMIEQGAGCILNVASAAGIRPHSGMGIYSVSKAAVIILTQVLAMELGKYNITVNAIAPGPTKTKLAEYMLQTPATSERIVEDTALGRIAEPEDIVGTAILLASDASRHITGQTITVDGGSVMLSTY